MVRVRYSFGCRHTGRIENIKKQKTKYPDMIRDVIEVSDIILEILDARFVEETRNLEIEKDILNKKKILIYILNKVDLTNVKKLKKELSKDICPHIFVSTVKKIGLKKLKAQIKIEAKRISTKQKSKPNPRKRIHVGIIGYPNVGKSSIINFITRRGVAKTSKQAGFTKGMQKIRMSEGILILDTPGLIPASKYSTEKGSFAKDVKVGARTYSDVKNPEDIVFYLMKQYADEIEKFYKIKANKDSEILIEKLGLCKKFLQKGGEIDIDRTARIILKDWQEGKIKIR